MRRTTLAAAALVPCCALALSACGSKSADSASAGASASVVAQNNAHLTQAQLLARFKTAITGATALHMKGTMTDSGGKSTMDIQLNKDGTAEGTMTVDGMTTPIIVIGTTMYTQITPSYVKMMKSAMGAAPDTGIAAGADQFIKELAAGKWLKVSTLDSDGSDGSSDSGTSSTASASSTASSSSDGSADNELTFASMADQLSSGKSDKFTYLRTSTVDGQQVAQYKDVSTDGTGPSVATMDIPLTGSPLPIMEDAGSQGSMTFTWNEPTKITAPPAADVVTMPEALLGDDSAASAAPSAATN